jgi:hypothetical protein
VQIGKFLCAASLLGVILGTSPVAFQKQASLKASVRGKSLQIGNVQLKYLGQNKVTNGKQVVDRADAYMLEIAEGTDFMPERYVQVWFTVEPNQQLKTISLTSKAVSFGTDEYRKQHYPSNKPHGSVGRGITQVFARGSSNGSTDMHGDLIAGYLKITQVKGDRVFGQIKLRVANAPGTFVEGPFVAQYVSLGR